MAKNNGALLFDSDEKESLAKKVSSGTYTLVKNYVGAIKVVSDKNYVSEIKLIKPDFSFRRKFKRKLWLTFIASCTEKYVLSIEKVNELDKQNLQQIINLEDTKYHIQHVTENYLNIFTKNQQFLIYPYEKKSFLANYKEALKELRAKKDGGFYLPFANR